jgi:hypothetical protein
MRNRVILGWRDNGSIMGGFHVVNDEGSFHIPIRIYPGEDFEGIPWETIVERMPGYLEWDEDLQFVGMFANDDQRNSE